MTKGSIREQLPGQACRSSSYSITNPPLIVVVAMLGNLLEAGEQVYASYTQNTHTTLARIHTYTQRVRERERELEYKITKTHTRQTYTLC
jgi:hypothetical protein